MDLKKLLLIVLAVGIPMGLIGLALAGGAIWYLRGQEETATPQPEQITLCDMNASGICVVSFGEDPLNQMVINLRLPRENYPAMTAIVLSHGVSREYPCRAVDNDPQSVYCTGPKTPLTEPIDIQLLRAGSDEVVAQGTLIVMAIALASPMNFTSMPEALTGEPLATATVFVGPMPRAKGTTSGLSGTPAPTGTQRPGTPGTRTQSLTPGMSPSVTGTGNTPMPTNTATPTPTSTQY